VNGVRTTREGPNLVQTLYVNGEAVRSQVTPAFDLAAMIAAATARLHHAIDVRAGMELARPLKSYPRRLGQLYKRKQ
jgi:hypothetical protein